MVIRFVTLMLWFGGLAVFRFGVCLFAFCVVATAIGLLLCARFPGFCVLFCCCGGLVNSVGYVH